MLKINQLRFHFEGQPLIFNDVTFDLPRGARALLVGSNGAGKSTLLRLVAGNHLIPESAIQWDDKSPFHDLSLSRKIALVEGELPLNLDIPVEDFLKNRADSTRERELIELLRINPKWRMHQISTGERKKVQILLALREPAELFLLDEITAHLDLKMRKNFLDWLKKQSLTQNTTVIYATHIFDGLVRSSESWASHVIYLKPKTGLSDQEFFVSELNQIEALRDRTLLEWCEQWME